MESAVGDFVPKNGFKFTYYLTRSMRVSGVVIFLLLDKSAVSVKASCPPPGLKSDHTLVIINHHANPLLIVIVIFFGCFHPPPSLWWKWLWKFKMVLTADLPDFADGSDLPDGAGSTGWCWSTWWTPRGWFQGWPQTLWSPGSTQWPGLQPKSNDNVLWHLQITPWHHSPCQKVRDPWTQWQIWGKGSPTNLELYRDRFPKVIFV